MRPPRGGGRGGGFRGGRDGGFRGGRDGGGRGRGGFGRGGGGFGRGGGGFGRGGGFRDEGPPSEVVGCFFFHFETSEAFQFLCSLLGISSTVFED